MKKLIAILLTIFLCACGGGSGGEFNGGSIVLLGSVASSTGNPYYPMTAGTWRTYEVRDLFGIWNARTGAIDDVSTGPVLRTQTQEYAITKCAAAYGDAPLFSAFWHLGGHDAGIAPLPQATLTDAVFTSPSGVEYIGEAISELGTTAMPGEAKLTMHPVVGEILDGYSRFTQSCTDQVVKIDSYHWQYKTVAHFDMWRGYADVWQVSLIEFNGNGVPATVYNYFFANGVGPVCYRYGRLDAQGNVTQQYEFFSPPTT